MAANLHSLTIPFVTSSLSGRVTPHVLLTKHGFPASEEARHAPGAAGMCFSAPPSTPPPPQVLWTLYTLSDFIRQKEEDRPCVPGRRSNPRTQKGVRTIIRKKRQVRQTWSNDHSISLITYATSWWRPRGYPSGTCILTPGLTPLAPRTLTNPDRASSASYLVNARFAH